PAGLLAGAGRPDRDAVAAAAAVLPDPADARPERADVLAELDVTPRGAHPEGADRVPRGGRRRGHPGRQTTSRVREAAAVAAATGVRRPRSRAGAEQLQRKPDRAAGANTP